MNPSLSTHVLIAGAGPTGLTLACDLARRGVACRIVDKAPAHFAGSRGKGVQPRTLEVLDDLGVVDAAMAAGAAYPLIRAYDGAAVLGDWAMFERRAPAPDVPYPNILLLGQWRTEEILRARLAEHGVRVELATELTGFEQDGGGVTATLVRAGETERVRAGYLVGADGGRSFVRRALGVGFQGEMLEADRALVGDVRADGLDRERWHAWPKARGGPVALCPLPGTERFQILIPIHGDEAPELTVEVVERLFHERTGRSDVRLHDASWLSLYRPSVRMVDRYRAGRVFLAGDAAHVHPAAGGQGLNTGVQDAYNLGWKLGQVLAGAPAALLDTYEEERLPVAAAMLGLTSRLHRRTAGSQPAGAPSSIRTGTRAPATTSTAMRSCWSARTATSDGALPRARSSSSKTSFARWSGDRVVHPRVRLARWAALRRFLRRAGGWREEPPLLAGPSASARLASPSRGRASRKNGVQGLSLCQARALLRLCSAVR
jgi:2-polyprenyl-6-methoxyphenol hydroxylase-like FAD-dependent oxidoreductase